MKKAIALKGNNFILRPYKKGDEFSIAENANNKELAKNMYEGFPSPYTIKDAKKWINKNLKPKKIKDGLNLTIEIDNKACGGIGARISENKIASFGYWLGEKYWGKGIVTEAVKLFTEYLFKNTKIIKISATVFPWNKGSQRVLEKNGFKLEGIIRRGYLKNGRMEDDYVYGKLRDE